MDLPRSVDKKGGKEAVKARETSRRMCIRDKTGVQEESKAEMVKAWRVASVGK